MPLYEYECTACHRHTEKRQKFSDPEITECPFCGGELKRVITAPAFALKGGGWYADGYGNAKPAAAADASGGKETAAAGTSDGGKDAKPAAAAPAAGATAAPAAAAPAASAPAASPAADKK